MEKSHLANDVSVEASQSVGQRDARPPEGPNTPPTTSKAGKANGGLQAWLQVAGSFVLYLNTWGESPKPVACNAERHLH